MLNEMIKIYVIEVEEILYSFMEEDDYVVFGSYYKIYGKFYLVGVFLNKFCILMNL